MQKKASSDSQTAPAPEDKQSDIKTILEELIMGKQQLPAKTIVPEKIESINDNIDFENLKNQPVLKLEPRRDKQKKILADLEGGTLAQEEVKEKPFDLKQALIFSEILKRPEY